jgi:colanic acid biosynthesis glycosyl transferase WcaI
VGLVFQDVVGLAARQSGVRGGARLAGATGRLERAVARRATRIGLTADGFAPFFLEGGLDPRRVVRLRNWVERAAPDRSAARARAELGWGASDFVCLHAGNMGAKQELDTLLDTAALLGAEDGVRVVLAGDGNDRPRLERRAADRRLENLSFADVQAPGAYEAMLEAADVLLVNQRASVLDMSLPSKLTAYFAAGRPVVAAVAAASETAAEVRRAGAGRVVAPGDPAAVARALLELRSDGDQRVQLGARGRRYAAEHLSRDAVLAGWVEFVDATREGGRP